MSLDEDKKYTRVIELDVIYKFVAHNISIWVHLNW